MKHTVGCIFALLLIGTSALAFNVTLVEATPKTIYVDGSNIVGPWNGTRDYPYQNITDGLKQASDNDTIYVYSGTYYEHLLINKSVSIKGENRTTTILDGENQDLTILNVTAHHVTIQGFTIRHTAGSEPPTSGISVRSSWNIIQDLTIEETYYGVDLEGNYSRIIDNKIVDNYFDGLVIRRKSNHNTIIKNWVTNNPTGIRLAGSLNIIRENVIEHNEKGVLLVKETKFDKIHNNQISNNSYGIKIEKASNNTFAGNTITNNNQTGIYCDDYDSQYNTFYHNNFVNNKKQIYMVFINCSWDNGLEGNYWSDYDSVDLNNDGIGDEVPHNGDYYPLMSMFSSFNTSLVKYVSVISNSTIEDFKYFQSNSTIKMFVSNTFENQTVGFCRVCIPYILMNVTNISVVIDHGQTRLLYYNYILYDNGTHRWIYFAYPNSIHEIDIIPEFQLEVAALMLIVATGLTVILGKKGLFLQ